MAVALVSGESHTVGDAHVPFSLQSITKLFTFVIALKLMGEGLWQRVGREPRARRSTPSCSSKPKTASRAIRSSTRARW
ncbi:Thermolabile glutaminase [Hydrogenophaga sp. T4]|nr:Thermolabile glutaminase [Hydrogenophaga sp. T4]